LSAVPFIIFSGYIDRWPGGPDDPVPDEVLPKPLTMDTLLRSINKALSRRRAAAAAAAARPPQS
jgi:two-component SAPR family response regulator